MLHEGVINTLEDVYSNINVYQAILVLRESDIGYTTDHYTEALQDLQALEYPVVHVRSSSEFHNLCKGQRYRLFLMTPNVFKSLQCMDSITLVACETRQCFEIVVGTHTGTQIVVCLDTS